MAHRVARVVLAWAAVGTAEVMVAGQIPVTQSTPLEMDHGAPVVSVVVNGRGPFRFIVDTGTNCDAIVSPAVVRKLGLPFAGQVKLTDLSGRPARALDRTRLDSLSLAGTEFRSVPAVVSQLPDGDGRFDGVLGFRLFRDKLLTLDYPNRRLTLSSGALSPGAAPNVLPFRMNNGIPSVTVAIGSAQVEAEIDSGGQGLNLPESLAKKLRFESSTAEIAHGQTQVSAFAVRGGVFQGEVVLAGFRFTHPFIEINPVLPMANLGSGALQDFAVTFDQRSRLVRFDSALSEIHLEGPGRLRPRPRPYDELIGTVVVHETY